MAGLARRVAVILARWALALTSPAIAGPTSSNGTANASSRSMIAIMNASGSLNQAVQAASTHWNLGAVGLSCSEVCRSRVCNESAWPVTQSAFEAVTRSLSITCASVANLSSEEEGVGPGRREDNHQCFWLGRTPGHLPHGHGNTSRCGASQAGFQRLCPCAPSAEKSVAAVPPAKERDSGGTTASEAPAAAVSSPTSFQEILGVVGTSSTAEEGMSPDHLVDGSGLKEGAHQDGQLGIVWNTATNVKGGNASWLQLDLGDTYDIAALKFWNYHSTASTDDRRGLKTFTLMAWGANESWSTVSTGVHLARAGRSASDPYYGFAYKAAPNALPSPFDQGSSDVVSWLPLTARYLRLTDLENYGVCKWGNGYGLSEIKIFRIAEATTTTEPSVAEEATTTREKRALLTDRDEEDVSSSSEEPRPVASTTDSARKPHHHPHKGTFAGPPAGAEEEADVVFLDEAGVLPIVLLGVTCLGWIAFALWRKCCPELLPCKPWGRKSGCDPLCVEEEEALSSQEARYKEAAQKEDAVPSESESEDEAPSQKCSVGGLRRSMFQRLSRGIRSPRGVSPRGGRRPTSPRGSTAPVSPYPRSPKRNG